MLSRLLRTFTPALLLGASLFAISACSTASSHAPVTGVLNWREAAQNGTSLQTGLPAAAIVDGDDANLRWTFDTPGRGTPVIAEYDDGPRLFVLGYPGEGADLLETIYCLDPETGEELWSHGYADFISDIVYNRYSIGAPSIDAETGNVYFQTSPGLLIAMDRDGNELWQVSLLEEFGKLTFPNGRTGCVTLDGDLAIINCISSNWGSEGPARNRFYAFDKNTGELVWSSTPGVGPPFLSDSSFSTPMFENRRGMHVFYAGTGCGNLVCVNAHNGQPMWRYQMSKGGVNSSPVLYDNGTPNVAMDDLIIQVHGVENIDDTGRGYMIAVRADHAIISAIESTDSPLQLDTDYVAWRNDDVSMFTSSPTLVDGVVYQCTEDGYLVAIDAGNGNTLWRVKVGADQLHASPVYADGRLYIPFWNDGLFIITPGRDGPVSIERTELRGQCIGTPTVWNGKVYIHTTETLYCFGNDSGGVLAQETDNSDTYVGEIPAATSLMAQPAEFLLRPGQTLTPAVQGTDSTGAAAHADLSELGYDYFIPPTARVRVQLDATIDGQSITASDNNAPSAGAFQASAGELTGTFRGRILPEPPYAFDFEANELSETDETDSVAYAYPPLPWLGARLKWQVRVDPTDPDNFVLAKTLDRVLFQRSMIFMGHPEDTGYTVQADVMSDGNRRGMSVVGVINQRYIIAMDGNKQAIEVSSNHSRVSVTEPFACTPGTWYTIKSMIVHNGDGSGTVLGKIWPRGEEEPADWTIAVELNHIHTQGSPGIYGFSPQSRHRVYVDNVLVTPNE